MKARMSFKFTAILALGLALASATHAQIVRLSTTQGDIRIALEAEKAPKSVANFVQYVKAGHYNGVIFHRVIENFMIQTGGYTPKLDQKPTKPPIPLESSNGLPNVRGSVAMARTGDPNSATSQFFINTVDNPSLDADAMRKGTGYAVFGHVIEGMDVVDKIRALPTREAGMHQNLPVTQVLITKAIVEAKK